MIKIGEFSKLAQTPVATLRYYDQVGLLKPVSVDPATGYRFYSTSQLPRLHRLLALKDLGFTLEQIETVLTENPSPERLRGMLQLRSAQLAQEVAATQSRLEQVETRLKQLERGPLSRYDVRLKNVEPLLIAYIRATLPHHGAAGALFGEVYEALGEHAADALGPNPGEGGQTLVLCFDTEFKETDVEKAAAFVLRRPAPERGRMKVETLPAVTVAATIHHGSYETIDDAHEAVHAWIEENGYRIAGPDREINLYNAPPFRRDDPTFVTEIQYPIERETEP